MLHKLVLADVNETVRSTKPNIHLATENLVACIALGIIGANGKKSLTHISANPLSPESMDYTFGQEKDLDLLFRRESEFVGGIKRIEIVINEQYYTDPSLMQHKYVVDIIANIARRYSNIVNFLITPNGKYGLEHDKIPSNVQQINSPSYIGNYNLAADLICRIINGQALQKISYIDDELQEFEAKPEVIAFIKRVQKDASYSKAIAENLARNYPRASDVAFVTERIQWYANLAYFALTKRGKEHLFKEHQFYTRLVVKSAPEVAVLKSILQVELYTGYQSGKLGVIDAVIDLDKCNNSNQIESKLRELSIPYTFQAFKGNKQYLIIPGVNTPNIARIILAHQPIVEKSTDEKSGFAVIQSITVSASENVPAVQHVTDNNPASNVPITNMNMVKTTPKESKGELFWLLPCGTAGLIYSVYSSTEILQACLFSGIILSTLYQVHKISTSNQILARNNALSFSTCLLNVACLVMPTSQVAVAACISINLIMTYVERSNIKDFAQNAYGSALS